MLTRWQELKTRALIILAVGLMFAARPDAAWAQRATEVLLGKWQIDVERSRQLLGERFDENVVALKVEVEFQKDGVLFVGFAFGDQPHRDKANWKVVKDNGNNVLIEIAREGNEENIDKYVIVYLDGGLIKIESAEEGREAFILKRVKPSDK